MKNRLHLLFVMACTYLAAGLLGGLFYREFTKINKFPSGEFTQLKVVHTHFLALGFLVALIVLILEHLFTLSASKKLFAWFFWVYNAGLVVSTSMMITHGCMTVLGIPHSKAISGIAGLGHMSLTAGFIMLMVLLSRGIKRSQAAA